MKLITGGFKEGGDIPGSYARKGADICHLMPGAPPIRTPEVSPVEPPGCSIRYLRSSAHTDVRQL